jgi:Flp pilus assembly protein TadG
MRDSSVSEERSISIRKPSSGSRGQALIMLAVAFVVLGGMLGLAIDVGIAYFIQARLSQAVDAAALAGARSLARGSTTDDQATNALAVADKYFTANFPAGFWGCTTQIDKNKPYYWVDVGAVGSKIRKLNYRATATTPLYFLRLIGKTSATVAAKAVAQRRDANIVIILDRSGSMKNSVSQLVSSANWFVGQFAVGRDQVGLVTFGGTYNLIKPSTAFSPAVTNAINTLLPVTTSGTTTDHVAGTTNHSQPLWVAYQALAEINQPDALNVIVFFTDGQPNTVLADWQPYLKYRTATSGRNGHAACNNGQTAGVYNPVIGYSLVVSDSSGNPTATWGLFATASPIPPYQPTSTNAGTVATDYVSAAYDLNDSSPTKELLSMANNSGCSFTSDYTKVASDFTQIPPADYYGNLTASSTQYKSVTLTSFNTTYLIAAAFNAGDYAAQRMRAGVLGSPTAIVPLVDTIALNTGQTPDSVYMKRLANVNDSTNKIYDKSAPTGLYTYAATTADLQPAFVQIASQILHLAQ